VHHPSLARWLAEGRVVPLCPEVAGGLPVPRPPAERLGDRILTIHGADVTANFESGAELALAAALRHGARIAILKEGSPSCGSSYVYDGTFSGVRVPGRGAAAERLVKAGIEVFSENQIDEAEAYLERLSR
jgi:uncharacterized protein YbbK (DUF523 family)